MLEKGKTLGTTGEVGTGGDRRGGAPQMARRTGVNAPLASRGAALRCKGRRPRCEGNTRRARPKSFGRARRVVEAGRPVEFRALAGNPEGKRRGSSAWRVVDGLRDCQHCHRRAEPKRINRVWGDEKEPRRQSKFASGIWRRYSGQASNDGRLGSCPRSGLRRPGCASNSDGWTRAGCLV